MDKYQQQIIHDHVRQAVHMLECWSTAFVWFLGTNAPVTQALEDIVVADLPDDAVTIRVITGVTLRAIEDVSGGWNTTNNDQYIQIQNSVGGTWRNAFLIPSGSWGMTANSFEPRCATYWAADHDISMEIDGNGTYNTRWQNAQFLANNWMPYDLQVGVRIWFTTDQV